MCFASNTMSRRSTFSHSTAGLGGITLTWEVSSTRIGVCCGPLITTEERQVNSVCFIGVAIASMTDTGNSLCDSIPAVFPMIALVEAKGLIGSIKSDRAACCTQRKT